MALLRFYQNILDLVFTTDSIETRQIYINFWRVKLGEYRAYPSLFTKEPLRLVVQKYKLPIDLFDSFLSAAETSFLMKEFEDKAALDDELVAMAHLTAAPLCKLICMVLDPLEPIDQELCDLFGKGILAMSLTHLYPDLIERRDIYKELLQVRESLAERENRRLRVLIAIVNLSLQILKRQEFIKHVPRLPLVDKILFKAV